MLRDRAKDVLGLVLGKGPPSRPGARGPGLPLPGEGGTGSVLRRDRSRLLRLEAPLGSIWCKPP